MKTISKAAGAIVVIAALLTTNVMAQEKRMPTLEDLIPGGESYRFVENIYGLTWWGDLCVKPEDNRLVSINPKDGKENTLATLEDINGALEKEGLNKLRTLTSLQFPWADKTQLVIRARNNFIVYDWTTKTIVKQSVIKDRAASTDYNTESGHVAYTIGNNLYVDDKAVSNEPDGIVVGQSVHRNEFGINKGTFWSPKGNLLAFYRMDESMVVEYPLVNINAREAELTPVRYPMAGMTSHKVTVGIYNVASGKTIYLDAGDPTDRYFTNISWAPDEKSLYLIELNRDQNHAKLCQYDVESGKLTGIIYEETNPKYVEPENPIVFLPWDNTKFIYQSQRDGFNHLYLMDTKVAVKPEKHSSATGGTYTETLKTTQLTKGNWLVQNIVGYNAKAREIIFTSTQYSPNESSIESVNTNGQIKTIANNGGVHQPLLSASGSYVIDRYSTPTQPREIEVYDIHRKNNKSIRLLSADDPYKDLIIPQVETGVITAADGKTDLYYRMCKPADFDPSKKYPVIVYVYGGPHAQMIHNGYLYDARSWDLYMASKGYIMFTVDNRGSSNRGFEFESATFRHLGVEESKDQAKGVEFLKTLPYVDANRIGVHGWSFGGHMTTSLMLRYPDLFKVGVAGGPVIDWQFYEVMYGERYMDTPQANPDGYKETNLRNLAGNLKGHLLVIHGYQDETCVPQHTLSFMKACIDARVYPDLFLYPGHQHNMVGRDRVHLHEKITRYFEDYLK